jgi:hypothetical protein
MNVNARETGKASTSSAAAATWWEPGEEPDGKKRLYRQKDVNHPHGSATEG